jgi:tetratricopeptide (TPR) repeat protein
MNTLSGRFILFTSVVAVTACASGQGTTRVPTPAAAPTVSVEVLYESGQDDDVVNRVNAAGAAAAPADAWFAAQSELRLGRRAEAVDRLSRLSDTASDAGVQAAARLELARLNNDAAAIDAARAAAAGFGDNVFAQYEVGVSYLAQNDYMAAARAFDHCIDLAPTFAYAYYQAALAYDRLNRMDLMANRFDRFVRLAPNAPERPQVDSVLRTVGGR